MTDRECVQTEDEQVKEEYADLLFDVECSVRYHSRRQSLFEGVQHFSMFIGFISASGAMYRLFDALGREWVVGESKINRVAHAICYNELVRAQKRETKQYVQIKPKHRLLGWWTGRFDDDLFLGPSIKERTF